MTHETFTPAHSEGGKRHPPIGYLVDENHSFLRALSRRLQSAVYRVETFASAEEFLKCNRPDAAGCIVLELQIPGLDGLALQKLLAQAEDPLPMIFLTAHGDVSSSVRAMKQGAVDFLVKPVQWDQLIEALQRALHRCTAEQQTRQQKREWRARYERLTLREREVFVFMVGGLPNKQIADVLGTSERTIKAHRAQLMQKMGVQSAVQLGRAVEWLGEFSQAAPALDMARGQSK